MGRGTYGEVWDGTGDPQGGPGRVGGPSKKSGTCQGTLGEVRDGSGDPRAGPGRVWEHLGRYGTGLGTLGGPGRVGGPSWRFATGRWTFG